MIDSILTLVSGLLLAMGCFFMLSGAIGILRFPDFYTRMHAAGITDTLATFLVITGLMLIAGWSLALFKLGLILLFIFFTSPTASHALARSAQHSELKLQSLWEGSASNGRSQKKISTKGSEPDTAVEAADVSR